MSTGEIGQERDRVGKLLNEERRHMAETPEEATRMSREMAAITEQARTAELLAKENEKDACDAN